jgi:hypothetical protein
LCRNKQGFDRCQLVEHVFSGGIIFHFVTIGTGLIKCQDWQPETRIQ